MTLIYEHVGLTVSDLDRSIDFYTTLFGFHILRKTTTNAYLYLGNDLLELTQNKNNLSGKKNLETIENWSERMYEHNGISHIGFRVDNLDNAIKKIIKLGGKLVIPPYKFEPKIIYAADLENEKLKRASKPFQSKQWWNIAAFSDPDGIILEIIER